MTALAIVISLAVVALLVYANYRLVPFHPNAQVLCKLWYRVEHPLHHRKNNGYHFALVTSSTR